MNNVHPIFQSILDGIMPPETEEQKDARMAKDGWHAWVYNGIKQYWRMSPTRGPQPEDGGVYCERCQHFYVGENRCPRH